MLPRVGRKARRKNDESSDCGGFDGLFRQTALARAAAQTHCDPETSAQTAQISGLKVLKPSGSKPYGFVRKTDISIGLHALTSSGAWDFPVRGREVTLNNPSEPRIRAFEDQSEDIEWSKHAMAAMPPASHFAYHPVTPENRRRGASYWDEERSILTPTDCRHCQSPIPATE